MGNSLIVPPILTSDAMLHRQVRIYQPSKSTMQSAKGKTKRWILDWDTLQGAGRWENPLMGWASSADYMQGTQMLFRTREAAVAFVSFLTSLIRYCANTTCCAVTGWRIDVRPRSRVGTTWFPSRRRQRFHQRTTVRYLNSPMPPWFLFTRASADL